MLGLGEARVFSGSWWGYLDGSQTPGPAEGEAEGHICSVLSLPVAPSFSFPSSPGPDGSHLTLHSLPDRC